MAAHNAGGIVLAQAMPRACRWARKFLRAVEQRTFSGSHAAARGREVLYVTERCVFRLTAAGLELIEIAPGVDLQRDILDRMDFMPIVRAPRTMDARLFSPEPMNLRADLLPAPDRPGPAAAAS